MKAWAFVFGALFGGAMLAAACGGTGGSSTFVPVDAGPDVTLVDASKLITGETGTSACNALTCTKLGYNCGKTGDGCGGTLDCGSCSGSETCGGGGTFSVCGGAGPCVPKTCASIGSTCGPEGDGCGNLLQCGTCSPPDICGGGGQPSVCGTNGVPHPDGGLEGGACVPETCASQNVTCGPAGDGCGNVLSCGSCTTPGQTCGGGGVNGACGSAAACVPNTCAGLGANCGPVGDGCGNLLQCGTCTSPKTCGGGGAPSVCAANAAPHPDGGLEGGACVPKTCASQSISCGPAGDGCGNVLQCGTCTSPKTCGGGGVNGACGAPTACVPKTCTGLGFNCGPEADGCGNLLQCGTCTLPNICGGGGKPGVCGDVPTCTNLCLDQKTCTGTVTTTLTGTVVAGTLPTYVPAGDSPDPIPNVLVYVPNATPSAFTKGVECKTCGADVTGAPLVEATTDYQGNFTLTNVPVPANGIIPLVIQLGHWRRIFGLGNTANPGFKVTSCATTSAGQIRMPRTHSEGDIPLTAISTGAIDPMECVLLKMGVDTSEFKDPGGGGRIEVYQGNGAIIDDFTPDETSLVPDSTNGTATLDQYDQVIFPCWAEDPLAGVDNVKTSKQQQNVVSYANAGGRMFATHLSYSWLEFAGATPFNTTATWVGDPDNSSSGPDIEYDTGTATIQQGTSADTLTFYKWMNALAWSGASAGAFNIVQERNNFSATGAGSQLWIQGSKAAPAVTDPANGTTYSASFPLVYTFATPYSTATPPPTQCGKVIYSDFHVSVIQGGGSDDEDDVFPAECTTAPMSAQEKALEYLIWDLASCLPGPPGATCTPTTCAAIGATCGPVGDGCGGTLQCGTCNGCQTCGGGGTPSVCGGVCCKSETCAGQNISCGPAGDGCGNELQCGTCPAGLKCGGGGITGKCGAVDSGAACTPRTCATQGFNCGPTGDGCGNELQCGTCKAPQTCGGGGKTSVCGGSSSK